METIETHGVAIPPFGLGTFRMPGDVARPVVESGLELGFRQIDTAAMYDNEAAIGAALAASGINRADLFVTTKVWHDKLRHPQGRSPLRPGPDVLTFEPPFHIPHSPSLKSGTAEEPRTQRTGGSET